MWERGHVGSSKTFRGDLGNPTKKSGAAPRYLTNFIYFDMLCSTKKLGRETGEMIITQQTDYALRILRALLDGELHTMGQIAQTQLLPRSFAYKILKKLNQSGLIQVVRGTSGGCRLTADLSRTSLYDLMLAIGEQGNLSPCMSPDYRCAWRACHGECTVHCKLLEIQESLNRELRSHSLQEILTGS